MKIKFKSTGLNINTVIAVLYWHGIEAQRIVKLPPITACDWGFDGLPYGKYIIKLYESEDGVTLSKMIMDFWVRLDYSGKMPRILKCRK
jgi:hypothetical protein